MLTLHTVHTHLFGWELKGCQNWDYWSWPQFYDVWNNSKGTAIFVCVVDSNLFRVSPRYVDIDISTSQQHVNCMELIEYIVVFNILQVSSIRYSYMLPGKPLTRGYYNWHPVY